MIALAPSIASQPNRRLVALTGATGYVGGRLAPELLTRGYRIRCLVRNAQKLQSRDWASHPGVEIVQCSLDDESTVVNALQGCEAAYYLVHSMLSSAEDYAESDRARATSFAKAARQAGVQRIVYLGGLGDDCDDLSRHLASRQQVEASLRSAGLPVTVLRAAMIIGSGSASFEILRYLVERLPVMVTPRWVRTESQPIAIRNVINYLADALNEPRTIGMTLDIGGPQIVTYSGLLRMMAEALGLPRRLVLPVPVLTPRLSALWIHIVTPIDSRIARPLAEGLRNRVVCRNDIARRLMPQELLTPQLAIEMAVARLNSGQIPTSWSDAGPVPGDPDWAGGTTFVDRRQIEVEASATEVFSAVCRVGGGHGYYAADWLWRIRGAIDRLIGGPGLRRGRRSSESIGFGDALDFWRVTRIVPDHTLELRAEMKLPGVATLAFELEQLDAQRTLLVQTARFRPRGLSGLVYWYAVFPLHGFVFSGLMRGIRRAATHASFNRTRSPTEMSIRNVRSDDMLLDPSLAKHSDSTSEQPHETRGRGK
jgi:uncharacterized protein YbjT (DUF2867 family)